MDIKAVKQELWAIGVVADHKNLSPNDQVRWMHLLLTQILELVEDESNDPGICSICLNSVNYKIIHELHDILTKDFP